ncbi:hypothetical protein GP486_007894 [Trichoglossum hirsutum]|uniref:Major facilitator superfamily (MFS) profile domain-containing protein n=1 Tax=Trichoglossum hirsutum TaxID=265104 RepID=A0A9P8IEZ8_9PEZI|nr:hypothetical protein GP486_007894 [Trichoglossum hirsutum]
MAKIADVFGRLEAFSLCILLYVIGYIQMAASNSVGTYASAQIFYAAGFTGLQVLQQVFVADTTDLLNRALLTSLPDTPFLVTVWVGPLLSGSLLKHTTWRWGYGIWAIVLPVAFSPLALSLFLNQRKATRMKLLPPPPPRKRDQSLLQTLKRLWFVLDIMGIILLTSAFWSMLVPLTLAASKKDGWKDASVIAMMVVQNQSVAAAGHVTQTFSFSATVASVAISFAIKYAKHYKYFVVGGSCIYLASIGLMIGYRAEGRRSTIGKIVGTQVVFGIGGGMLNVPAQLGVQASVKHRDVAAATALFLTISNLGGAVGSAISGAIWTANIPAKLELYLPAASKEDAGKIFGSIITALSYPVGSPERSAINRAYQETMDKLLLAAICVCVPLVLLSLTMRNYNLSQEEGGGGGGGSSGPS